MLQEIVIAWGSFIGKSRFSCHRSKWPMPARDKRWDFTGCHPFPNPWTLGYHHIHHVFCRWLPLPSTTDHYNTMFAFVDRLVFFWIHKKWYKRIPVNRTKSHPNILGWFYFLFYQQKNGAAYVTGGCVLIRNQANDLLGDIKKQLQIVG